MTYLNRCRHEFKLSIGNRSMTDEEQTQVVKDAGVSWNNKSEEEKDAFKSLYKAVVRRQR